MLELGIKPDVVSCTALISALGADAQWERAERVVSWMLQVSERSFRGRLHSITATNQAELSSGLHFGTLGLTAGKYEPLQSVCPSAMVHSYAHLRSLSKAVLQSCASVRSI